MTIVIDVGHVSPDAFRRRSMRRLAVFASLILVLLAVAAALIIVQGIDRQLRDVVHTYEVRNQARELTIALSETESSQRGYVLTQDAAYLSTYRRAASALQSRLLSLIAVTENDEGQSARVTNVGADIDAKTAEMERTIDLVENDRAAEARSLVQEGMGQQLMDSVRGQLELFISEENAKLLQRNRAIDELRRWLVGAIVIALAAAVILSYILLLRSRRQVHALARSTSLLTSENEELEAHIRERTQAVEDARLHAERERERVEALLQDANHRIGNSLATVSSLLGLQLMRTKSEEVTSALESARLRVHAIASAHRRLRLGSDLETVSADEFLEAVIEDIANTAIGNAQVRIQSRIDPIVVGARDATTIGILVGELVTNALKHAFPNGRSGMVTVVLARDATGVPTLSVSDNGVGVEGGVVSDTGLGSVIIKQLAHQFDGEPHYLTQPGGGLTVTVPLPKVESASPNSLLSSLE